MPDFLRRAIRTFLDAAISTFLLLVSLPQFVDTVGGQPIPKFSALESLVVATCWSGVIATLNFAKNALEDNTSFPALLKSPSNDGVNPTP